MHLVFSYAYEQSQGHERKFHQAISSFVAGTIYVAPPDGNGHIRRLRVSAIVRPQPDLRQIARAVLEIAQTGP